MRATNACPGLPAAHLRQRRRLSRTSTPACTASGVRPSRTRMSSSTASAWNHGIRAGVDRGEELVLPAFRIPGQVALRALRRAARLRACPASGQTRRRASSPAGCATSPSAVRREMWQLPAPVGSGAGRLRLGRCTRQLPQCADLRPGRGPAPLLAPCGTCWRRTSSASTAFTGPRSCSQPGMSCPRAVRARLPATSTTARSRVARERARPARPRSTSTASTPARFWAARVVPFGQDGNSCSTASATATSASSANDLGNLLSRTTAMIARYRDGDLAPAPDESGELAAAASALHDGIPAAFDRWDVTGALDTDLGRTSAGSTAMSSRRSRGSWRRIPTARRELDRALYELVDGLRDRRRRARGVPARDAPSGSSRRSGQPRRRRLGQRRVRPH